MNLAERYDGVKLSLIKKISLKGRDEQELQYLFPSLYGSKAVTRNTKGLYKHFDRRHRKSFLSLLTP
jgi:adenine-specific DNA methylase